MVGCVEGILGLRPDMDGIKLSPSIPKDWKNFEITKSFRGKKLHILVENPNGKECGCEKIMLNGKELETNYIDSSLLKEENEILLIL